MFQSAKRDPMFHLLLFSLTMQSCAALEDTFMIDEFSGMYSSHRSVEKSIAIGIDEYLFTETPSATPIIEPTHQPVFSTNLSHAGESFSALPSFVASGEPTIHPSISPTQATFLTPTIIPTLTPSRITEVTRSPSAAPSLQSQPIISFVSVLSFANSTNQTLSRDQQAVLLNATATSMGVQEDDCTVASITSTPTRRRLVHGLSELMLQIQDRLCGNMRGSAVASSNDSDEALQNHRSTDAAAIDVRSKGVLSSHRVLQEENQLYSIDVEVLTTLNLVDFESADPSELYTSLTNRLEEAVRTGSYAESMQKASTAKGVVSISLTISGVIVRSMVVLLPPSSEPTMGPSNKPAAVSELMVADGVILLAFGGIIFGVGVLTIFYYHVFRKSNRVVDIYSAHV